MFAYPVSFETHVTLEAREAILTLKAQEKRETYTLDKYGFKTFPILNWLILLA